MTGVYLLHFSTPYKHAAHYIGWAKMVDARILDHTLGYGARLTQVVTDAGIQLIKARVWEGKDRYFERQLKKYHKTKLLCPICSGESANNRMRG